MNSEVVSLGFPDGSLQEVLKGREFTRINEKQISFFLNTAFTTDEFEDWKKALPLETEALASVSSPAVTLTVQPDTRFRMPNAAYWHSCLPSASKRLPLYSV